MAQKESIYPVACITSSFGQIVMMSFFRMMMTGSVFLKNLTDYLEQFEIRIHAYGLMDTHFHLLIESRKSNLSEYLRRVLTACAVWFNKRHHTRGHIFAGRFKSIVVERGYYLVAVSRYIHRNPVEASIVRNAEDYAWSSMRVYTGKSEMGFTKKRWLKLSII